MIDYIIGSNCGRSAWLRPVVAGCTFVSHFATRRMLPRATSWSSSNRDRTRWRGCGWQAWRNLASKLERLAFDFGVGKLTGYFFCHILISGICPKAMLRTHELSWSRSFIGTYWKPHGPSSDHGQSWPKEMNRQGEQFREQLEFLMQATEMLKRRLREMTKTRSFGSTGCTGSMDLRVQRLQGSDTE